MHRICQKVVRKLRDEFKVNESAFDAYESALDELEEKNDNEDFKPSRLTSKTNKSGLSIKFMKMRRNIAYYVVGDQLGQPSTAPSQPSLWNPPSAVTKSTWKKRKPKAQE